MLAGYQLHASMQACKNEVAVIAFNMQHVRFALHVRTHGDGSAIRVANWQLYRYVQARKP
jgi:hypothetical protein